MRSSLRGWSSSTSKTVGITAAIEQPSGSQEFQGSKFFLAAVKGAFL